jgi:plastocyanin
VTRRRVAALFALAVASAVAVAAVAALAAGNRIHRLKLPPRPAFPRALSIDETEYQLNPSRTVVSSGTVDIYVYNRGMDDHDLVVYDQAGTSLGQSILPPGAADQIRVTLPAGDYRVVCSLFAGTPISHETLGMVFTLTAQDPPTAPAASLPALRRSP